MTDDLALLEEDDAAGVGQDGGHVGGDEVLALADAAIAQMNGEPAYA